MKTTTALATALLATGMVSQAQAATATFITSSPYGQFSDSPFSSIASGNPNFFLEDFEDGALNTPGVSAVGGTVVGPGASVDSVDGDDGSLDGNGNAGHSWYSNGASSLSFSFNAGTLGQLPTHVGIVWTDIGSNPGGFFGFGSFVVRAFDSLGVSLGGVLFDNLGDGLISGGSAEDRFFGAIFDGGISRLTITSLDGSTDWEVDHLQYGIAPVPVPGAVWMLAPALAGLMGLRRKRV
jgi:hypothetical protein